MEKLTESDFVRTEEPGRLEDIGYFNSNNGVLAFVSADGFYNVQWWTRENQQYLETEGYREKNIRVPFSSKLNKDKEWMLKNVGPNPLMEEHNSHIGMIKAVSWAAAEGLIKPN